MTIFVGDPGIQSKYMTIIGRLRKVVYITKNVAQAVAILNRVGTIDIEF